MNHENHLMVFVLNYSVCKEPDIIFFVKYIFLALEEMAVATRGIK